MKKFIKLLFIVLIALFSVSVKAQVFNKIKKKVNEEVNKVTGDNNSKESQQTDQGTNNNSVSPPSGSESLTGVEKMPIYKLEEGEHIDYRESKIMISSDNKISGLVIVNKKNERFVVENGVKKGPYTVKNIPLDFLNQADRTTKAAPTEYNPNEMVEIYQKYIESDNDKSYIVFNGKKFGPFSMLEAMKMNPQKTKFVALVSNDIDDNNKQKLLINQDGKKVELSKVGQLMGQMIINNQFTDAAFWGQDLADMQAGKMQVVLATLGGINQLFVHPLNSVWYDANSHLLATSEKTVFFNGKALKEFETTVGSEWRDIWLNNDGSAWAALVDNQLYFSDGNKVNDGFSVSSAVQNGKTVINWIAVSKQDLSISRYAKTL